MFCILDGLTHSPHKIFCGSNMNRHCWILSVFLNMACIIALSGKTLVFFQIHGYISVFLNQFLLCYNLVHILFGLVLCMRMQFEDNFFFNEEIFKIWFNVFHSQIKKYIIVGDETKVDVITFILFFKKILFIWNIIDILTQFRSTITALPKNTLLWYLRYNAWTFNIYN